MTRVLSTPSAMLNLSTLLRSSREKSFRLPTISDIWPMPYWPS